MVASGAQQTNMLKRGFPHPLVEEFVAALNGRLAANGKALGPPTFSTAGMTLTKVEAAS